MTPDAPETVDEEKPSLQTASPARLPLSAHDLLLPRRRSLAISISILTVIVATGEPRAGPPELASPNNYLGLLV